MCRHPISILAFLTFLNVMSLVDRQLIVGFGELITRNLRLELSEFGLLTGPAFHIFYILVGVFLGWLSDRFKRPRMIAAGLLLWSMCTAVSGFAHTFWQMAAARMLVGVGEATLTPAALSMLSDLFCARSRGRAFSTYYLGIPIGAGLSLILAGTLGPLLGSWRACFLLLGGVGFPLGLAAWFVADPPRGAKEKRAPARDRALPHLCEILCSLVRRPALLLTILGGIALQFAVSTTHFDTIWLQRECGFTQPQAGKFLGTWYLFGGVLGNLVGGSLGDYFCQRLRGGRLIFLACGEIFLFPAMLFFRIMPLDSHWFGMACLCFGILNTFFYGSFFATVHNLVDVQMRSTMTAFVIFCINVLGFVPGSFVTGRLCQVFEGRVERPISWGLFAAGLVGLLSVPFFLLAAGCFRRNAARRPSALSNLEFRDKN